MGRYVLELEPEVRAWLELLSDDDYDRVEAKADVLLSFPTTLDEPLSRNLGDGVRELRFGLNGASIRITYWLAPEQRIVLLTVFGKSRMRETAEVNRAKQAKKICEADHDHAATTYDRSQEG